MAKHPVDTGADRIALEYVGNGFLHGIPARDLTEAEVKLYGGLNYLISTGLYAKPEKAPAQVQESEK